MTIEETSTAMREATKAAALRDGWTHVRVDPNGMIVVDIENGMPIEKFFDLCDKALSAGQIPNFEYFSQYPELRGNA